MRLYRATKEGAIVEWESWINKVLHLGNRLWRREMLSKTLQIK